MNLDKWTKIGILWGAVSILLNILAVENFGLDVLRRNICFTNPRLVCDAANLSFSVNYILRALLILPATVLRILQNYLITGTGTRAEAGDFILMLILFPIFLLVSCAIGVIITKGTNELYKKLKSNF